MADLTVLQTNLGIVFNHIALLQQALVHRSYRNENPDSFSLSNERLEFLGDALLGYVVAEELYSRFPRFSEGELTQLRAKLVCRQTLAAVALSLHLGDYLYLGYGEEESGGCYRQSNLCGALEAVIGAASIDQGFDVAKGLVLKLLRTELDKAITEGPLKNSKSRLQELIQAEWQATPVYHILDATGPAHEKVFTVEVLAGDTVLGRGTGKSKRAAEQEAAQAALQKWSK